MALTSFLTGITEPIEFSFMFLAPALYVVHAVIFGLSMLICNSIGVLIGCSFSMGFIDYVLNWNLATHPELIIPIGIVFGLLYYVVFSQVIVIFELPTIGRFSDADDEELDDSTLATTIIDGLGGRENLVEVDNCVTRLRITVADGTKVDEKALNSIGAVKGLFAKDTAVQIVLGFRAENIAGEIHALKRN